MRGHGSWRAASRELAEVVREAGPRVALGCAVVAALVGMPMLIRWLELFGSSAS